MSGLLGVLGFWVWDHVPSAKGAWAILSSGGCPRSQGFPFGCAYDGLPGACGSLSVTYGDTACLLTVSFHVDIFSIMASRSGHVDCRDRHRH